MLGLSAKVTMPNDSLIRRPFWNSETGLEFRNNRLGKAKQLFDNFEIMKQPFRSAKTVVSGVPNGRFQDSYYCAKLKYQIPNQSENLASIRSNALI